MLKDKTQHESGILNLFNRLIEKSAIYINIFSAADNDSVIEMQR
jgi:hypothetical protein